MGALTRDDRVAGGLYGLLVGDAVGVPYEFHDPRNLPPIDAIDLVPPDGHRVPDGRPFYRSHARVPPGTWSDDGAQALCLLASLLDRGGVDPEDLGQRLLAWWHQGAFTVDGAFDIGNTTSAAFAALERGVPAVSAGPTTERDNGNGALMRVLPLALWHRGSDAALVADAVLQGRVTHGHPRSGVCCAFACLWARALLDGASASEGWDAAGAALRRLADVPQAEVDGLLGFATPGGTGYVVDTLASARVALEAGPYPDVVRRAIAFGFDTDTTACVAGGLAGIRDGLAAIPARWLDALRGKPLVEPLLEALTAR